MPVSERTAAPSTATAVSRGSGQLITEPTCSAALREACEKTFLNVRYAMMTAAGSTLLISAIDASASATALAANLAILAAFEGERVILVDADPHTPTLDSVFALSTTVGFKDLIQLDSLKLADALNSVVEVPGLQVIGSGTAGSVAGGLSHAPYLRETLQLLRDSAQRVILIGSPVLEQVDSFDLSRHVDGVVVAVMPGKTHRLDAARARELMDRVKAPLLGVVLTGRPI